MPWLGSVYLAFFAAVGITSFYFGFREGEKRWRVWCDTFAGTILALLFVSQWHRGLREALGALSPVLFIMAMGWEIFDTPRELRTVYENPDLTPLEKKIAPIFGIGICLPIYMIAGWAAFHIHR